MRPAPDMPPDMPPDALPGVLGEIAEAIGEDQARLVAEKLGGRRVWLAARPGPDGALARVVGVERARAVAEALGSNLEITIPMGGWAGEAGRRRRIVELLGRGWSHPRIAGAVGVHQRTVERVAARLRLDPDQPGLFDD